MPRPSGLPPASSPHPPPPPEMRGVSGRLRRAGAPPCKGFRNARSDAAGRAGRPLAGIPAEPASGPGSRGRSRPPASAPEPLSRRRPDRLRTPPSPDGPARSTAARMPGLHHPAPSAASPLAGLRRAARRGRALERRPRPAASARPRRALAAAALLALPLLAALAPAAQAQDTLVSNTGQPSLLTTRNQVAVAFTTGSNGYGYTLSAVDIPLREVSGLDTVVTIRAGGGANPGAIVATLANPSSFTSNAVNTFAAPAGTTLAASTTYFLVVNDGRNRAAANVGLTVTTSNAQTGAAGWSIADAGRFVSGRNWVDGPSLGTSIRFALKGAPNGPAAPTGFTATAGPGSGQVTLRWTASDDSRITSYQYDNWHVTPGSWGGWRNFSPGAGPGATGGRISGLVNGDQYGFRIRARAGALQGAASDAATATPAANPPPFKPTGLTATPGDGEVVLSWDNPRDSRISLYQVRQRASGGSWGGWVTIGTSDANTTRLTRGGLTNGTAYDFQIRARAGTLLSPDSDTVSATPQGTPVAQFASSAGSTPENVSASIPISIDPTPLAAITLAYTVTGTATRGSGGDFTAPASDSVDVPPGEAGAYIDISIIQDALREPDETVILTLADGAGYDLGARTTFTLTIGDDDPPLAPAGLAAAAGDGQVVLRWTDPSDAAISGYQFRQRTPPDTGSWGTWTAIAGSTAATTTHTVTGLTNGTAYGFQVRALDGTLEGAASSEATATPTAATAGVTTAQPTDRAVTEGDASDTATFTVALSTRPSDTVAVTVTAPAGLELAGPGGSTFSGSATLAFTASTWNSAQTVTMRATDDSADSPIGRELSVTYRTSSRDSGYRSLSGTAATVTVADNDPTAVTLAGAAGDVAEGATKTFTVTLDRGLVNGEALPVPLTFGGEATRGTDYTTACPTTLPTGVACANLDSGNATVTFTGPTTGTTATTVTLTLTAAADNTAESGGETVVIGLGTLNANSGTGLGGGASGADSLADFRIVDPESVTVAFASGSTAVTVAEGDDSHAELTLALSAARGAATAVRLVSTDGTATAGSDFAGGPYTVDFPAGDTRATLRIAIEDENVPEEREEFSVTIVAQGLPAGVSVGAPSESTVAIRDDDRPPPAPTGLTATPGAGSVALAWRYAPHPPPAVDRTAEFQYRRGTGDPVSWGGWTTIPGSGPGTRSHTVRGLAGGAEYAFQVRARSRPGSGFRPGTASATARATPLAGLADKVRSWMAETSCAAAEACVARWKRALKALGQTDPDLADVEPMTFGEALTLAYTPGVGQGAGWLEVAKALQALEVERVVITIAASPPGPVAEGAEVAFTLTAAAAPSTTFDVFVNVADAPGSDFLAAADEGQRRVQLRAGATSASFKVRTVADRNDEPDGAIAASLAAVPAVYTVGSPASASVQVTDDDGEGVAPAPPVVTIAGGGPVAEGADAAFTVRRTGDASAALTVLLSVSEAAGGGRDFVAAGNEGFKRVAIPAGSAEAAYAVPTVDDGADEPNGAVTVALRADDAYELGDPASAAVEVRDNDGAPPLPAVSISGGAGITEGAAASFTLTASPPPSAPLSVSVTVSETGSFAASGEAGARAVTVPVSGTATFTVATDDDPTDEPDGAVTATLGAGAGYTLAAASASVAVADNDAAPATCAATPAGLVATVRGYYQSNRNRADRDFGENWLRVLIAFGAETSATLEPYTAAEARAGEAVWRGWRPVRVELERLENCASPPTPPAPPAPPGAPRVAVAAGAGVGEGTAASFTLTASPAPASDLAVSYTVADAANADFVAAENEGAKTAVILAGQSSADIEVATVADSADEPSGPVSVTVDSGDGYAPGDPASAEVRVADDDATTVALAGPAGDIAEAGGIKAFTVTLGRTLEAHEWLRAPLVFGGGATRGDDWTAVCAEAPGVYCGPLHTYVSPHVKFVGASGAPAAATVTLSAVQDSLDEGAGETVTVGLGEVTTNAGGGAAASGGLRFIIADDDDPLPAVTVAAGPGVAEGAAAAFTLTVSPAPSSALTVGYTVSDADGSDFLAAGDEGARTVTIAAGEASKTVSVPTTADDADEADGPVTLRLAAGDGYQLGAPSSAMVTVSDDDARTLPGLSISDARGAEGKPMRFTITLSHASEKAVRVRMDVRDATPPSARWERYDYARPYYDVTFAPGETEQRRWVYIYDDAHDEDEETFEAVLSRAEGAVIAKAVGVGTIANDDPLPAAYLARFGRAVADQALAGVASRIAASRSPGLEARLAGGAPGGRPGMDAAGGGMAAAGMASGPGGASGAPGAGASGGMPRAQGRAGGPGAGMSVRDALLSSGFSLTGGGDGAGGSLALWGRAAQGRFDGGAEGAGTGVRLDGEVATAMLGADYARDGWLVGLALARSASEGGYAGLGGGAAPACPGGAEGGPPPPCGGDAPRVDAGRVRASLTSATSYASLRLSERFGAWGAAGAGAGGVELRTAGSAYRAGTRWRMAAAGARGELAGGGPGGLSLSLTSDALWTRTDSEATRDLAASSSATTRLRLGIEGGWRLALGRGMSLAPTLEAGARHDGGDAGSGFGVELGGGLAWAAPALGLSLDVSGRALVAHEDGGMEDMGFSAALAFDPAPGGGRGPSLALRRDLGGRSAGGLEALLRPAAPDSREGGGAGGAAAAAGRWAAEAAWGLPAFGGRFTGAPHAGVGLGAGAREYTLGWRLAPHDPDAPEISLGVRAARREGRAAKPEHAFGLEIEARW